MTWLDVLAYTSRAYLWNYLADSLQILHTTHPVGLNVLGVTVQSHVLRSTFGR